MAGKVLELETILRPDELAINIANKWVAWNNSRSTKVAEWTEVNSYIYATDTTKTTNSALPWSNKTTIPKLCQIRDNLHSNYVASMFPKRKWLVWQGDTEESEQADKKRSIEAYISWAIDRNEFYDEMSKLVLDYIDYGNAFVTVEWVDRRNILEDEDGTRREQVGYVGPMVRRISPLDIVFNPIASSFTDSPKIIRSLLSIGEVKEMIERLSAEDPDTKEDLIELYDYMNNVRAQVAAHPSAEVTTRETVYNISGFGTFAEYLSSDYVELLTFYGDIFDKKTGSFDRNQVVTVIDRHKVLCKRPNPSFFGTAPIYAAGWRVRPDNLWAMGPLDNLVGMQYRIDHLENMKADIWDLTRFPVFKIKGYVEDFEWKPGERIIIGDDSDVALVSPEPQVLSFNTEIATLEAKMEEMAGSPKEAMGFRTPGEKTKYEVQRLENAASRIFQNKIAQFERTIVEPALNALLELARRNLDKISIRLWDNDNKFADFLELTSSDITGQGRIYPVAARHFAEQAEMVQNVTNFYNSAAGTDPEVRLHFSSINIARMFEQLLDLEDYKIVEPFIRLTEKANAQRLANVNEENVTAEIATPSGVLPGDYVG